MKSHKEKNEQKQENEVEEEIQENELKEELNKDKEKVKELTGALQRLQAEFENSQKRLQKEQDEFKKYSNASLIEQILPVLDSLEQGVQHNKDFVQVYEQLFSVLKKNGLEKIEVNVGDSFNHDNMEALMQEKNDSLEEGEVVQVLSTGYLLNGKVLRTAKISINKE